MIKTTEESIVKAFVDGFYPKVTSIVIAPVTVPTDAQIRSPMTPGPVKVDHHIKDITVISSIRVVPVTSSDPVAIPVAVSKGGSFPSIGKSTTIEQEKLQPFLAIVAPVSDLIHATETPVVVSLEVHLVKDFTILHSQDPKEVIRMVSFRQTNPNGIRFILTQKSIIGGINTLQILISYLYSILVLKRQIKPIIKTYKYL